MKKDKKIKIEINGHRITILEKTVEFYDNFDPKLKTEPVQIYRCQFEDSIKVWKMGHDILKNRRGEDFERYASFITSFDGILKQNSGKLGGKILNITRKFRSPRISTKIIGNTDYNLDREQVIDQIIINKAESKEKEVTNYFKDEFRHIKSSDDFGELYERKISGLFKSSFNDNEVPSEDYKGFKEKFINLNIAGRHQEAMNFWKNYQKRRSYNSLFPKMLAEEINDLLYFCYECAMKAVYIKC